MKPILPTILEMPGHVVQPIDLRIGFSNVVTALTTLNARPGIALPFTPRVFQDWRMTAVQAANTDNMIEIFEAMKLDGAANRSPVRYFLQKYATPLACLFANPQYIPDVGQDLANGLLGRQSRVEPQRGAAPVAETATRHWSSGHVSTPTLGYAREYLNLETTIETGPQPVGLPNWDYDDTSQLKRTGADDPQTSMVLTSGGGSPPPTFSDMCAQLTMQIDKPAFSDKLIPDVKKLTTRDASASSAWGLMQGAEEQTRRMTATGLLYTQQAMGFWIHFTASLYDMAYAIAWELSPRERPILEFKKKLIDELKRRIPVHPFLMTIANMYSRVSISTYFGEKPCAIRHSVDEVDAIVKRTSSAMPSSGTANSRLAQLVVSDALIDYSRLRELTKAGETWAAALIQTVAPALTADEQQRLLQVGNQRWRSHGEVIEWLQRNSQYVTLWPEITRTLGWTSPMAAPSVRIEAAGADFVLTDGDFYSDNPMSVLSGLRPSLSVGNKKVSGFSRRFDAAFNTGELPTDANLADRTSTTTVAISWSTLTAKGHTANTRGMQNTPRWFITPGMSMGEAGAETRFYSPNSPDATGEQVVQFYKERSPEGYVKQWYGDPAVATSVLEDGVKYMRTDWDAWSEDADALKTQRVLIQKYGPANTDRGEQTLYFTRSDWNLRFPVRLARTYNYEFYNVLGELVQSQRYDGHVVFDDTIHLTETVAPVDAVVNMIRVNAPVFDTVTVEEAKMPEAPSL